MGTNKKNKKIFMMTSSLSTRNKGDPTEFIDIQDYKDTIMEDVPLMKYFDILD